VVRFRFGEDDLLRTRFAITPLIELIASIYALRDPVRHAVHRPWAEWARPRVADLDLALLDAATPFGTEFWPVFVEPPPAAPRTDIDAELARVAATPPDMVRAELAHAYPDGAPRPFLEDPAAALATLVVQMRAFWDAVLEPWWPRIVAALEAEVAARARRLADEGPRAAFADLHPTVEWEAGTLCVRPTLRSPADVDLAGRGLLLVPAAFTWPLVWPRPDPPWDPALVYPPPGIADLWSSGDPRHPALEALLGRRRARVLLELERPGSTLDLARRLAVSAGGVSDHLKVLREAGLVTGRREGRQVIYARTAKGDALVS
jgi:DNA-binding transcriptional ArsR family regulator